MKENQKKEEKVLYTKHGKKRNQGVPSYVNGKKALSYVKGDKGTLEGYTMLTELLESFNSPDLPSFTVDF